MDCEHICDTVVYSCLNKCKQDSSCMRQCWLDHDKCAINCPCNEECPDGCPTPYDGHPCKTWFCQGYVEFCAAADDPDRESCDGWDENSCESKGCCWVPFHVHNPAVPYCHQKKRENINPRDPLITPLMFM